MRQFKEGDVCVFTSVSDELDSFYNDIHSVNIIKGTKFIINKIRSSSMICICLGNRIVLLDREYDCFTNYKEPKGILKYI